MTLHEMAARSGTNFSHKIGRASLHALIGACLASGTLVESKSTEYTFYLRFQPRTLRCTVPGAVAFNHPATDTTHWVWAPTGRIFTLCISRKAGCVGPNQQACWSVHGRHGTLPVQVVFNTFPTPDTWGRTASIGFRSAYNHLNHVSWWYPGTAQPGDGPEIEPEDALDFLADWCPRSYDIAGRIGGRVLVHWRDSHSRQWQHGSTAADSDDGILWVAGGNQGRINVLDLRDDLVVADRAGGGAGAPNALAPTPERVPENAGDDRVVDDGPGIAAAAPAVAEAPVAGNAGGLGLRNTVAGAPAADTTGQQGAGAPAAETTGQQGQFFDVAEGAAADWRRVVRPVVILGNEAAISAQLSFLTCSVAIFQLQLLLIALLIFF